MGRWVAFSWALLALLAPPFALSAVPRGALERPAEAGMQRPGCGGRDAEAGDAPRAGGAGADRGLCRG